MLKQISFLFAAFLVIGLASCGPQRYAMTSQVEDDDIYYNPGDMYISEAEALSQEAEEEQNEEQYAEEGYDYFDEDGSAPQNVTINNYYSNRWNPRFDRFNQPGLNLYYNFGWNRPGMGFGINNGFNNGWNNGFNSPYYYGYSAFGYSPWAPINDPFFNPYNPYSNGFFNPYYDPFFDPFWGPSWNDPCWNAWNNPWAWNPYNNGTWGNPYANPWSYGWGNPWVGGNDTWANNINYSYGHRPGLSASSSGGSAYGNGSIYEGRVTPPSEPQGRVDNRVDRPNTDGETVGRTDQGRTTPRETQSDRTEYDYFEPTRTEPTRTEPTRTEPAERERNTGFDWGSIFDNNSNNQRNDSNNNNSNNNWNNQQRNDNRQPSYTPPRNNNSNSRSGTRNSNSNTRSKSTSSGGKKKR